MTLTRVVGALMLLGGVLSCAAHAQLVARSAKAASAASNSVVTDTRRRSPDAPFSFRGVALGITIDEFRAGSTVRATPVGSVPICETDVQAGALGMRLKSHDSLSVACRWGHRDDERWAVSQAVVDGAPALEHVMRFARIDGQGALRLYEMSFVIDELTAEDLRDAQRGGAGRDADVRMGKRGEFDHAVLSARQPQRHAHVSAEGLGCVDESARAAMAGERRRCGLTWADDCQATLITGAIPTPKPGGVRIGRLTSTPFILSATEPA
ncbi:hypothetical protein OKW30_004069 [Paraburkholderia sp. Clong3]